MTALPPDAWVPVPLRWRYVAPGDVFVGRDGALWHVERTGSSYGPGVEVVASRGPDTHAADVDPDERVHVLVPVTEAEAVELLRDELGARLAGRREHNADTT